MTVAAWSPLGNGVLSGKYTGGSSPTRRLDPASISEHDLAVARAVQGAADELGVTPAQVALAWTRVRSRAVHPIVGARSLDQLTDNLGALAVELPAELVARLEEATAFKAGFPADFIEQTTPWVFGAAATATD